MALIAGGEVAPAAAQPFSLTDLGTLGGASSVAFAINSAGQIAGWSTTPASALPHAFLYDGTQMRDLGTLGGNYSVAFGIDDLGRVVGVATTASDVEYHAFLYDGAGMHDLGTLGGTFSRAYAINAAGQVVGVSTIAGDAEYHAFRYDNTGMQDLGTLGGEFSTAIGISVDGRVVGDATDDGLEPRRAFLFDGSLHDLGTLGGTESRAYAINALGQVVGEAMTLVSPAPHAFLYDGAIMRDLGTLGGSASRAYAINDAGKVVGSATGPGDTAEFAFLYSDGRMLDLNRLIPSDSGWTLSQAQGINNAGQIVGSGRVGEQSRAFLLVPTGEEVPLPPAPPTGLTASLVSSAKIALSWSDNSDDETCFQIERKSGDGDFTPLASVGTNGTQYEDLSVSPSTSYTYRVRAVGSGDVSGYSNESGATTPSALPAAPGDLTAAAVSTDGIDLAWSDNSTNETAFAIWRKGAGSGYVRVAVVRPNVTRFSDRGLAPGTLYIYRIRATNNQGASDWAREVGSTTLAVPPAAPTDLTLEPVSSEGINLSWTNNSSTQTSLEVWRKTGDGDFERVAILNPNHTRFPDRGLSADLVYTYRVRATNSGGASDWSNEVSGSVLPLPPTAPAGLTARAISVEQIDLSWTDSSQTESGVEIWRKQAAGDFEQIAVLAANVTSFSDHGLSPDLPYTYRVRVLNAGGTSGWSNEASNFVLLAAPAAPTGLTAQAVTGDQIDLSWSDNSSNEFAFALWRKSGAGDFQRIAVLPPYITSFSDRGLDPTTAYTYRVRAINNGGASDWSNEASSYVLLPAPAAPTGLTAQPVAADQIDLSWSDNSSNEFSFAIWRKSGGSDFQRIAVVPANVTTFSDRGLIPTAAYTYRVRAINNGGASDWSNEANSYVLLPVPEAPTGLTAQPVAGDEISLNWSDNSSSEFAFAIWRKNGSGDLQRIAVVPANVTSFSDRGLDPTTAYTYRVRAINNGGASDWSNEASSYVLLPAPAAPTGLTAQPVAADQIDLSWSDNSSNEFAFALWRKSGTGDFQRIAVLPPNMTAFSDRGLSPDGTYTYRVRAINNGGLSEWSNEVSSYVLLPAPEAPGDLSAKVVSTGQIDLSWTDNSRNEFGFALWRKAGAGEFAPLVALPPDVTSYSDQSVAPGTDYSYRLRATNNGGVSPWSQEVVGSTPPLPPAAPTDVRPRVASPGQFTFSWRDNSANETAVLIYRRKGNGEYCRYAVLPPNAQLFVDTNIAPNITYTYRVQAIGVGGASGWSNEITWTAPPR